MNLMKSESETFEIIIFIHELTLGCLLPPNYEFASAL